MGLHSMQVERRKGVHYLPQRSPAWCDRVLHRSNLPLKQIKPLDYWCATDIASSDHKPVAASFQVPTIWRQDDPTITTRVHLVFTRIACTGLFMLRTRRGSTAMPTLPNPDIIMMGPCLGIEEAWRAGVVSQTRSPVWQSHPPVRLPLKPAAIQDLAHRRLLVRVVNVVEGKMVSGTSTSTLARGVLPLTAAATQWLQSASIPHLHKTTRVTVPLEFNGLPAGELEVDMLLEVEDTSLHKSPPQAPRPSAARALRQLRANATHGPSRSPRQSDTQARPDAIAATGELPKVAHSGGSVGGFSALRKSLLLFSARSINGSEGRS
ncbi:hypothetical protein QJQ45_014544 [Haematococcus lacustris]|nr:hypothetical protein QJQ45_014544 [Haematococcus lacustris]